MICETFEQELREAGKLYPERELKENNFAGFREQLNIYRDRVRDITKRFKAALLEHASLTNHPKAEKLVELAWDYGHDSGLADVELYFDQLSELFKEE